MAKVKLRAMFGHSSLSCCWLTTQIPTDI